MRLGVAGGLSEGWGVRGMASAGRCGEGAEGLGEGRGPRRATRAGMGGGKRISTRTADSGGGAGGGGFPLVCHVSSPRLSPDENVSIPICGGYLLFCYLIFCGNLCYVESK